MEKLFAYGTLKPGHAPAEVARAVDSLTVLGQGFVHGRLLNFGEYPGVLLDGKQSRVPGTVLRVPNDEVLRQLDAYEEFDRNHPKQSLFIRKKTLVTMDDGGEMECWIYELNPLTLATAV